MEQFLIILTLCTLSLVSSIYIEPKNEIVWFPNPDASSEQALIPAQLWPTSENFATNLSKVHFYLYTKDNPTNPDELFLDDVDSLSNSRFKINGPLKVMSHGFGGNIDHTFPWDTRAEYLKFPDNDMNIILLDWHELAANPDYYTAVVNAYAVSNHTADFLQFLLEQEMTTLDQVHLIGFSLGGQLVGITGNRFTVRTGDVLPRITSLDPAFPLFDNATADDADRISSDDAVFVDVVHSAGGTLGMTIPRGKVDFYPNGGVKQPGCGVDPVGSCAHGRAPAFFTESLFGTVPFTSCKCESWEEFEAGTCECTETAELGHWVDHSASGKFYLRTNEEPPYAIEFP